MKKRCFWPLLLPVGLAGIMLACIYLNRSQSTLVDCKLRLLTGYHCPGCGGTRCAESILTGNWSTAFGHNLMLTMGFIVFMTWSCYLIVRVSILGKPAPALPNVWAPWLWLGMVSIALFTVLRNVPVHPLTLLAP